MIKIHRYYNLPVSLINEQKNNPVMQDLYFTETGELEVEQGTIWSAEKPLEDNLLVYCIKGNGIVLISGEQISVSREQFFIIPNGKTFKFYSVPDKNSRFLVVSFNGNKTKMMNDSFSVVRNLIPSVNNLVANREMLFEEIFNNLSKGFYNENLEYVNFCFGHLLATFIYANKTSEDIAEESNPVIKRSIDYMNKNLHSRLTLKQISDEVGYSTTYFTTLFRKETGYPPLSYFSHLKILKATEYLDYTKKKVKEISFALSYSDPYYFTRDFKKKMGLSPRQYRNRVGK